MDNAKVNILMCGSKLEVKGGMVSVIKNYLNYDKWDRYNIIYIPTHVETTKIKLIVYFIISYLKIIMLLIKKKINIAHLHIAERGSFYRKAILLTTLNWFGIKIILHHHGAEFDEFYNDLTERKKKYVNKILESATLNIVLSNSLVLSIKSKAPNAQIEVLYNAVYTYDSNPYNEQAKNVLFLGRLGKRKGIYDLLKVIKNIDRELPSEIKFYLCGDGNIEEVKQCVDELKILHRVEYIGWLDYKQKIEFFKQSMINILPSYNEGLPMSILETMAYGIPNISTCIASIPEVIFNGENGYLVTPGNIDEIGEYLLYLCKSKELRKEFSTKSYRLIMNKFSIESNVLQLKEIYHNLQHSRSCL